MEGDRRTFTELVEQLRRHPSIRPSKRTRAVPSRPAGLLVGVREAGEELLGLAVLCDYEVPLTPRGVAVILELAGRWGLVEFERPGLQRLAGTRFADE